MPNNAHVSLYGNVIAEPRNSQYNNSSVLSFPVSVKTTMKKEGSQYYETNVYQVSVWGKQADNLLNYLQKGSNVWVNGELMLRSYKDRNGEEREQLTVTAQSVQITSGARKADNRQSAADNGEENPPF